MLLDYDLTFVTSFLLLVSTNYCNTAVGLMTQLLKHAPLEDTEINWK